MTVTTTLVEVFIGTDNCGLYTAEAYAELRLLFSTGDYHMHHARFVKIVDADPKSFTDLDQLRFQYFGDAK